MKLLLIAPKHKRTIFDRLHKSIARHAEVGDIRELSPDEEKNLARYFENNVDVNRYDRILLMIRLKHLIRQRAFLQTLPSLAFLEIDAWQDFHPKSKYRGRFSRHYKAIPWARVISTGFQVTQRLLARGIDAAFAPKGYDQALMENLHKPRTIEVGFIGSIKAGFYADRRNFLLQLAKVEPLVIARTKPGRDYVEKMNEIRFFISADVNFDEYMIKNFEAMAAGCVLCAFDQGETENRAIGLKDMENIVLYRSLDDLRSKLQLLRSDPALADRIAEAGQQFAEQNCTFETWGSNIVEALRPPLRSKTDYPFKSTGIRELFKRLAGI